MIVFIWDEWYPQLSQTIMTWPCPGYPPDEGEHERCGEQGQECRPVARRARRALLLDGPRTETSANNQ